MQEQRPEQRIELTDILRSTQKTQDELKGLRGEVEQRLSLRPAEIGKVFLGTESRKVVGQDGTIEELPWTLDSVLEEMSKSRQEELQGTKQLLAIDTIAALSAQEKFFSAKEHPLKNASTNNSAFILTILERVLASRDNQVGEIFPIYDTLTEEYWGAELLEVIRRTVLKPTTIIIEGYGQSGIYSVPGYYEEIFWEEREDLVTDDMENERDLNKYRQLEQERQKRGLETRSEDGWKEVLEKECFYLQGYLRKTIGRSLGKVVGTHDIARRITRNGVRVTNDEKLTRLQEKINRLEALEK